MGVEGVEGVDVDVDVDVAFEHDIAPVRGVTPRRIKSVARAAIAANVPRLVIVSSGSVSKPLSPVYVFLNFFGGIMRAKVRSIHWSPYDRNRVVNAVS